MQLGGRRDGHIWGSGGEVVVDGQDHIHDIHTEDFERIKNII